MAEPNPIPWIENTKPEQLIKPSIVQEIEKNGFVSQRCQK